MIASLNELFNRAWTSSTIPDDWAKGIITPIFKEGDRQNTANYRGITILSTVGKVFASILERRLADGVKMEECLNQNKLDLEPIEARSTIFSPWRR